MTPLGYLTLFTLIPVIFLLFALFPARQAVIYSYLWGWLFLPFKEYQLHGLTEYSKISAIPAGILMAGLVFDANRLLALRPKIWDIPAVIFTLCPLFSSLHNSIGSDGGWHDGLSAALYQFFYWTSGYLIGRIYFTDLEGLKDLAFGFIAGGVIYVPFCLYEARMSPQLNEKIYGFMQYQFLQSKRMGGYRPMVFMQHGIAVGMWMMSSTVVAIWLWWCGTFKRRWRYKAVWWVLALLVTTLLCRALEAAALMAAGLGVLALVKWPRTRLGLLLLVLVPPIYTFARVQGQFSGDWVVQLIAKGGPSFEDRAKSLKFRLENEDRLIARAEESETYGWGGWNRFQIEDEQGRDSVPDQQWVIAFGKTGLWGLISFETLLLLPCLVLMLRVPVKYWTHPAVAPAVVLAVLAAMHMWDCLLNAFINPFFMLACGGITGMLPVKINVVSSATVAAPAAPQARPAGLLASV